MSAPSRSAVFLYAPNLIGYSRVIATLVSIAVGRDNWALFSILYFISFALDAADGHVARYLNQCSTFGSVLDMVTDRCSTAMLLVLLAALDSSNYLLYATMLGLDISSHWFHMYSTLLTGAHHKSKESQKNFIMQLYYGNFHFFAYLCIGAELFYIAQYLSLFAAQMPSALATAFYILRLLVIPGWALKQFVNVVQLCTAAAVCADKDVKKE